MAQGLVSPGVATNEIDLSLVASNAGTTNTAFAGRFERGYAGKAVNINNVTELIDNFGKPSNSNFNDWFQCYYYLQYSNGLYVSRAVDENGSWTKLEGLEVKGTPNLGKVELTGTPDGIYPGSIVKFHHDSEEEYKITEIEFPEGGQKHKIILDVLNNDPGLFSVNVMGQTFSFNVEAPGVGVPGTPQPTRADIARGLSNAIDVPGVVVDSAEDTTVVLEAVNPGVRLTVEVTGGNINRTVVTEPVQPEGYELVFDDATDFTDIASPGANIFLKGQSVNAFRFVPEENEQPDQIKVLTATEQIPYVALYANEEEYDVVEDSIVFPENSVLKFMARGFGVYGNNIKVAVLREKDFKDSTTQIIPGVALAGLFEYKPLESKKEFCVVVLENDIIVERFTVSLDPQAKDYQGRTMFIDDIFRRKSSYLYCKTNLAATKMPKSCFGTEVLSLANGEEGQIGISELMNAYGSVADSTIFGDTEGLDIDYVIANEECRTAAGDLATKRQDCLAIIGAKYEIVGQKSTKIVELLLDDVNNGEIAGGSTRNNYCSYFGNYAQIWDQYNDKYRWISVAGMVAGRRAKTTYELYPWYAAAGEIQGQLTGVNKWAFSPNVGARDRLYTAQINAIVRFPGRGDQVYGQKTLQAANSAFSRINVRLLFNYIKRNLGVAMRSFVFELNDEFTRNRVEALISQFMDRIQTLRGVYEYGVQCNGDNNPPQVIDNQELRASVAIKPARIVEYIYLDLFCLGTDLSISEVLR